MKLPTQYPPEVPAVIAQRIKSSTGFNSFSSGVLLGPSLPDDVKKIITSRKNTLDAGRENETIGFYLMDGNSNPNVICYSCEKDDFNVELERMSVAIHAFKWLGVESLMIIDCVTPFEKPDDEIVCIHDHINMTGENPLDYWMMTNEPEEFFLDVKNLYESSKAVDIKSVIHLASVDATSLDVVKKAREFNTDTYGRAFVPESLISGYLGMTVTAIGLLDTFDINSLEKISKILLKIITKNPAL